MYLTPHILVSLFIHLYSTFIYYIYSVRIKKKKKNLLKISRFLLILTTNPGNLLNFSKFLLLLPGTLAILSFQHSSQSCVRLFATPWTIAHQAPVSMEFSRQEFCSGCHFLLQVIFPTQGWNLSLFDLLH